MSKNGKFEMMNSKTTESIVQIGLWNTVSNMTVIHQVTNSFHFVIIDLEHGFRNFDDFENQVNYVLSRDIDLFVRVRNYQDPWLQSMLDMGVKNFLIPQIRDLTEIDYFHSKVKFPPLGIRGYHPKNNHHLSKSSSQLPVDFIGIFPLIETKESIAILEKLFQHTGVSGFYFGIYDLAIEIANGNQMDPLIDEVLGRMAELGQVYEKELICMPRSLEDRINMVKLGVTRIVAGIDSELIAQTFDHLVQSHEN